MGVLDVFVTLGPVDALWGPADTPLTSPVAPADDTRGHHSIQRYNGVGRVLQDPLSLSPADTLNIPNS